MFKKILLFSCLLVLTNCAAPGSALLAPVFTGAKTGSVGQASLSYSTGRIMSEISELNEIYQKTEDKLIKAFETTGIPNILDTYVVKKIKISEVIEPEPLP